MYYNKYSQIDATFQYIAEHPRSKDLLDVYEFGVFKGESLKKICSYLKNIELFGTFVWGFDSFEGLGKETAGLEAFEKFTEGAYKFDLDCDPVKYVMDKINYKKSIIIKSKFEDLPKHSLVPCMMPAMLVHIDCDLFQPTVEALQFLRINNLIKKGTLVAFDEYSATSKLAGEEKAWLEMCVSNQIYTEEVWHYIYRDKSTGQKVRQSLWEVIR
jgi:hypothetical protein